MKLTKDYFIEGKIVPEGTEIEVVQERGRNNNRNIKENLFNNVKINLKENNESSEEEFVSALVGYFGLSPRRIIQAFNLYLELAEILDYSIVYPTIERFVYDVFNSFDLTKEDALLEDIWIDEIFITIYEEISNLMRNKLDKSIFSKFRKLINDRSKNKERFELMRKISSNKDILTINNLSQIIEDFF